MLGRADIMNVNGFTAGASSSTPVASSPNQSVALPPGWDVDRDEETGLQFYIDHNR